MEIGLPVTLDFKEIRELEPDILINVVPHTRRARTVHIVAQSK